MTHHCAICEDTGSRSKDPWGQLDCVACTVSDERAALNAWCAANNYGTNDAWDRWMIYQHGKTAAIPPLFRLVPVDPAAPVEVTATATGYKRVPIIPTKEMIDGAFDFVADPCWPEDLGRAYTAMVEAAPEEPCKN